MKAAGRLSATQDIFEGRSLPGRRAEDSCNGILKPGRRGAAGEMGRKRMGETDRPSRPSQQSRSQNSSETRHHYISPEAAGADIPTAHLSFDFPLFPFLSLDLLAC